MTKLILLGLFGAVMGYHQPYQTKPKSQKIDIRKNSTALFDDHISFATGHTRIGLQRKLPNINKILKANKHPTFLQQVASYFSGDVQIPQKNTNNVEYTGKLLMGSSRQPMNVVWDTGSDWLVMELEECETCKAPKYDPSQNPDSYKPIPGTEGVRDYGSTSTEGFLATDKVCLPEFNKETDEMGCIEGFQLFMINWQKGMDEIDGILGLMSNSKNPMTDAPYPENGYGALFVPALYDAKVISDNVFGFSMTDTKGDSFLDLGVLFDDSMRDKSELVWFKSEYDYYWSAKLEGVRFTYPNGDSKGVPMKEFKIEPSFGTTDTGTSCNYIPSTYYKTFIGHLTEAEPEAVFYDESNSWGVPCDSNKLPTVDFLMSGYWLQMDPKDYLGPIDPIDFPNECSICIAEETEDQTRWMLGDAFLRGWYSTHDYNSKMMGFAPHATSTKRAPVKGTVPKEMMDGGMDVVLIVVLSIIIVTVITLSIVFITLALNGSLGKGKDDMMVFIIKE